MVALAVKDGLPIVKDGKLLVGDPYCCCCYYYLYTVSARQHTRIASGIMVKKGQFVTTSHAGYWTDNKNENGGALNLASPLGLSIFDDIFPKPAIAIRQPLVNWVAPVNLQLYFRNDSDGLDELKPPTGGDNNDGYHYIKVRICNYLSNAPLPPPLVPN